MPETLEAREANGALLWREFMAASGQFDVATHHELTVGRFLMQASLQGGGMGQAVVGRERVRIDGQVTVVHLAQVY